MNNRPAVKVIIPYLAGIMLADKLNLNVNYILLLSILVIFPTIILYKKRYLVASSLMIFLIFFFIGFMRYKATVIPPYGFDKVIYQNVALEGLVIESKKERGSGSSLLVKGRTSLLSDPSVYMEGKVMVRSWEDESLSSNYGYGDYIYLEGKLTQQSLPRNPGLFNYRKYLNRQSIFATININDTNQIQKIGIAGNAFLRLVKKLRESILWVADEITPNREILGVSRQESFALLIGLILGEREEISNERYTDFIRTSTAHILAVSGFNFAILFGWFILLFDLIRKFLISINIRSTFFENKTKSYFFAFPVILIYACLVGPKYSVIRAFIFISIFILSILVNRDPDYFNDLAFAGLSVLIFLPGALWEVSFLLSFGTVASITYLIPFWQSWLVKINYEKWPKKVLYRILQAFAVSLSAQIGAGLIIANTFNTFSLSGILINPIIIPIVSLATPLGFASCLIGTMFLPFAKVLGFVNHIFICLLYKIIEIFANIPYSYFLVPANWFSLPMVIFYVSLIVFLVQIPKRFIFRTALPELKDELFKIFEDKGIFIPQNEDILDQGEKWIVNSGNKIFIAKKVKQRLETEKEKSMLDVYVRKRLFILSIVVITIFMCAISIVYDGKVMKVTYLDVGQGDSAFVKLPDGTNMLIDGGAYSKNFDSGSRVVAPFLERNGINKLDFVVASHPDNDHIGGLTYIVDNIKVKKVITGFYGLESPTSNSLVERLNQKNIDYNNASIDNIYTKGNIKIDSLNQGNYGFLNSQMNNNSVVIKITFKDTSFLFTGDIQEEAEQKLINSVNDLKTTVIKVPHHGDEASSSFKFLRATQPKVAVISVGYKNHYGHPSRMTLGRYKYYGIKTFRTDFDGAITIITDGRYGWVKTMK
ncbi:MAG: ComEC/Rec2 family competence protein [bacterium]